MKYKQDTLDVRVILKPYIMSKEKKGLIDMSAVDQRTQAVNTDKGTIVMIGPNAWHDSPTKPNLKKGDKVYYSKYGAKVLKDEDTDELYIICNDQDILVGYA